MFIIIEYISIYPEIIIIMASDETRCYYVSSRGLLKSCDIYPNPPVSSCASNVQYLHDFIKQKHKDTDTDTKTKIISIYVCCDALNYFVHNILPNTRIPFYLVCGDGDVTMFHEAISIEKFSILIKSPLLKGFFSQNMDIQKCRTELTRYITGSDSDSDSESEYIGKLHQIPIGMDYHTISSNPYHRWRNRIFNEGVTPVEQEIVLEQIRTSITPFYNRDCLIYSNVGLCPDRFNDRVNAIRTIPRELLIQQVSFIPRTETWKNMTNYAFVLSPFGNGMDCHRTWEALLCGCIPIVRTPVFRALFEDLPVLIVEEWSEISLSLLKKTINEFKMKHEKNEFHYEKLTLAYYTKQFQSSS